MYLYNFVFKNFIAGIKVRDYTYPKITFVPVATSFLDSPRIFRLKLSARVHNLTLRMAIGIADSVEVFRYVPRFTRD